jgi:hypothetical protein
VNPGSTHGNAICASVIQNKEKPAQIIRTKSLRASRLAFINDELPPPLFRDNQEVFKKAFFPLVWEP